MHATRTARTCRPTDRSSCGDGLPGSSGPRGCSGPNDLRRLPVERAVVAPGGRQMDARDRPAAGSGLEGDAATVSIDDATNDREPESRTGHRACGRRSVETVEDAGEVLPVDAWAVVADRDRAVAQAHVDLPTGRAPLARVVQHVDGRALELVTPALHARGVAVELDGDVEAGSA